MQGIEAECRQKVTGIVKQHPSLWRDHRRRNPEGRGPGRPAVPADGPSVVCHAVERRLVPQVENTLIEPILPMDLYEKPWEITTCEEEHLLWPEP